MSREHLQHTSEWLFSTCEELFQGTQAVAEGAWFSLMSLLPKTPLNSHSLLELVAWACISISAKCRGFQVSNEALCKLLGGGFTCNTLTQVELYVLQKTSLQAPPAAISELCTFLTEDQTVLDLALKVIKKWACKLTLLRCTPEEAAVASVLWALKDLGREEEKQALMAQLQWRS